MSYTYKQTSHKRLEDIPASWFFVCADDPNGGVYVLNEKILGGGCYVSKMTNEGRLHPYATAWDSDTLVIPVTLTILAVEDQR